MENFIITVGAAILIYVGIKLALGFLKKNRELDKEKEKTLNDGFSEVENKVRMYRNLRNTELARNRILFSYPCILLLLSSAQSDMLCICTNKRLFLKQKLPLINSG